MTDQREVETSEKPRGPVDGELLKHQGEALLNQAAQARRQPVTLREGAVRVKSDAAAAKPTIPRATARINGGYVDLLDEDPELAKALSDEDGRPPVQGLRARVLSIEKRVWQPPPYDPDRTYGLLVLDGLLGHRVTLGAAATIELLGHGDIVRPWQRLPETAIPAREDWRVLSPVRMAVLDERLTALTGRRPALAIAFAARLTKRCHASTYLAAIGHLGRVEDRLLAILWHLADNWGRVTPHGVRIPFRLTHEVLGELVGAKRPSVTIGLGYLRQEGHVALADDGTYLLIGNPPDWQSPD